MIHGTFRFPIMMIPIYDYDLCKIFFFSDCLVSALHVPVVRESVLSMYKTCYTNEYYILVTADDADIYRRSKVWLHISAAKIYNFSTILDYLLNIIQVCIFNQQQYHLCLQLLRPLSNTSKHFRLICTKMQCIGNMCCTSWHENNWPNYIDIVDNTKHKAQ